MESLQRTVVLGGLAAAITVVILTLLTTGERPNHDGNIALREPPPATPTATMRAARRLAEQAHHRTTIATFAGGCFWGMEEAFRHVPGVIETTSGYTGGTLAHPTYRQVSHGKTGHAESVRVTYDPAQVSYGHLLRIFFAAHDPTWQGERGSRYRSVLFFHTSTQRRLAEHACYDLGRKSAGQTVATQVRPASIFWTAEPHHQQYIARHPGASACSL